MCTYDLAKCTRTSVMCTKGLVYMYACKLNIPSKLSFPFFYQNPSSSKKMMGNIYVYAYVCREFIICSMYKLIL